MVVQTREAIGDPRSDVIRVVKDNGSGTNFNDSSAILVVSKCRLKGVLMCGLGQCGGHYIVESLEK